MIWFLPTSAHSLHSTPHPFSLIPLPPSLSHRNADSLSQCLPTYFKVFVSYIPSQLVFWINSQLGVISSEALFSRLFMAPWTQFPQIQSPNPSPGHNVLQVLSPNSPICLSQNHLQTNPLASPSINPPNTNYVHIYFCSQNCFPPAPATSPPPAITALDSDLWVSKFLSRATQKMIIFLFV